MTFSTGPLGTGPLIETGPLTETGPLSIFFL